MMKSMWVAACLSCLYGVSASLCYGDVVTICSSGIEVGVTDGEAFNIWITGLSAPLKVASCPGIDSVTGYGFAAPEYTLRGVAQDEQPDSEIMRWWGIVRPTVEKLDDATARLHWRACDSPLNVEGSTVFHCGEDYIDLTFSWTPGPAFTAPHGYASHMFAHYIKGGLSRTLYFYGVNGDGAEGWLSFGDGKDMPIWFFGGHIECGTVSYIQPGFPMIPGDDIPSSNETLPSLPYDSQQMVLTNLVEAPPAVRFLWPFYYGIIQGNNKYHDESLIYLAMFRPEDADCLRFSLWDWGGDNDQGRAAWDWQWVTPDPVIGQTYTYTVRLKFIRFEMPIGDPGKDSDELSLEIAVRCQETVIRAYADYTGIDYGQPMTLDTKTVLVLIGSLIVALNLFRRSGSPE